MLCLSNISSDKIFPFENRVCFMVMLVQIIDWWCQYRNWKVHSVLSFMFCTKSISALILTWQQWQKTFSEIQFLIVTLPIMSLDLLQPSLERSVLLAFVEKKDTWFVP